MTKDARWWVGEAACCRGLGGLSVSYNDSSLKDNVARLRKSSSTFSGREHRTAKCYEAAVDCWFQPFSNYISLSVQVCRPHDQCSYQRIR